VSNAGIISEHGFNVLVLTRADFRIHGEHGPIGFSEFLGLNGELSSSCILDKPEVSSAFAIDDDVKASVSTCLRRR